MNIKTFFSPTIILLFLTFMSTAPTVLGQQDVAAQENTDRKEPPKPVFSNLTGRIILGAFALEACYFSGDNATQETLKEQLNPATLLKNCAFEYCSYVATNISHEAGHAFAANYFNDDEINIHIGGNSTEQHKTLLTFNNLTIHGFDPLAGHTFFTKPLNNNKELDRVKYAIILLAGAFSGIISNILLKTGSSLIQTAKMPSASSLAFDPITLIQLFNGLVPFTTETSASSDATKLYLECLQVPKRTIDLLSKLGLPLIFLQEFLLIESQSERKGTAALHSKILLTIANILLRGFARFRI